MGAVGAGAFERGGRARAGDRGGSAGPAGPAAAQIYPNRDPQLAGFWKGAVRDSHAEMDASHRAADGVVVITGDASGDQGAAVTVVRPEDGERRAVWHYGPEESAPQQSSNWRELDTVVRPLEMWGAELAGQRVLVRTDNTTARAVVNNRGTVSANLQQLCARLVEVCRTHDLDVAAVHIPGVENTLADALSRFKRGVDKGDWMLARRAFGHAQQVVWEEFRGGADVGWVFGPGGQQQAAAAVLQCRAQPAAEAAGRGAFVLQPGFRAHRARAGPFPGGLPAGRGGDIGDLRAAGVGRPQLVAVAAGRAGGGVLPGGDAAVYVAGLEAVGSGAGAVRDGRSGG